MSDELQPPNFTGLPPIDAMAQYRLLIWLKWRLITRGFRRDKMRVVGTIIMLVFLGPMSICAAYYSWLFTHMFPNEAQTILTAILGIAYFIWVLTPLLGFSINESYDPTRLFVYPVPLWIIFAGNVTGSLIEFSTLLAIPALVSMVVAFSPNVGIGLLNTLLMLAFLVQTIATGQAIMMAMIGFLRSRRFRDITIVIFPMIALGWYTLQQVYLRQYVNRLDILPLLQSPIWKVVALLPPGWAAAGIAAMRQGDIVKGLLILLSLVALTGLMLVAAGAVLKQLYLGDRGPAATGKTAIDKPLPVVAPSQVGGLLERYGPVSALVLKEWRYLWREPQYKALAVNALYTVVAMTLPFLSVMKNQPGGRNPLGELFGGEWAHLGMAIGLSGVLILATLPLTFNVFGGDGAALTLLFSFPTPRRLLFIGKNIAHAPVVLGICLLGVTGGSILMGITDQLPGAIVWLVFAIPVVLAAGNLVSIRFPHRLMVRGQRFSRGGQISMGAASSPGAGCAFAFLYLLCYLATFVALLPVLAAVLLPATGIVPEMWYLVLVPVAAGYSGFLYWASLAIANDWTTQREPFIIARIVPTE